MKTTCPCDRAPRDTRGRIDRPTSARWLPLGLLALLLAATTGCGWNTAETEAADEDDAAAEHKKGRANRLAEESSPYLLLHAHNPVDWYPWGPEAFAKAKKENKPIFLSIGYSSCYWCHVMERESFSNKKIAEFMNEHFVNIKVDREERPDIDDIYMTSCVVYFQLIGSPQGGGWPLSMFLTPDAKPFAGGTYFPPEDAGGRMGFLSVVKRVDDLWKNQEAAIRQNGETLTAQVQQALKTKAPLTKVDVDRKLVTAVVDALKASYDEEYGGLDFSALNPEKPKFPVPAKLALLQHELRRESTDDTAKILYHTLDAIAAGGIQDHLAGGFHRYSTDRAWHVPHFEKMLYDQAQLADVYAEAYRQTQNGRYRDVAENILDYVLSDLTERDGKTPGGGFHSAMDAETDHIEGKYYVWEAAEIEGILGKADAATFMEAYGMREENPFEHGFVLHLPRALEATAAKLKMPLGELESKLDKMREKILVVRDKRDAPLKDDKILTNWNGLMIRAFARAGAALQRPDYVQVAERAARFVLNQMRQENGNLWHSYRQGKAKLNAYLDDYAFLVDGLLAIHAATGDEEWLIEAQKLTDLQIRLFWDEDEGGFFFTAHDHEPLIARTKPAYDSVIPSGNSVSARNLLRLATLTSNAEYRTRAEQILKLFAPLIERSPRGMTNLALATSEFLDPTDKPAAAGGAKLDLQNAAESSIRLVSGEKEQPIAAPKPNAGENPTVVGRAYLSVDRLPAGGKCRLLVLIKVADKWHINSNPAQPDYMVPTELTTKSKQGTKVLEIRYPTGKELEVDGLDEKVSVYEGQVAVYATIEVPQSAAGKTEEITLQVDYQACNDARCLRPSKFVLQGVIPVAGPGEAVKSINEKLFPK